MQTLPNYRIWNAKTLSLYEYFCPKLYICKNKQCQTNSAEQSKLSPNFTMVTSRRTQNMQEGAYVKTENPGFCLFFNLTGAHFRGELQHGGDVSQQKIKYRPTRTRNRWYLIVRRTICQESRLFSLGMVISIALEYKKHNFIVKPVIKQGYG